MTTLAQVTTAPSFRVPSPSKAALKSVLKFTMAAAFFAGIVAMAYLVLPHLEATGIWAYGVAFLIQATTSASVMIPIPGMAALTVMSQEMDIVTLAAFGAAGGAVGELVGYWIGAQGRGPLAKLGLYRKIEAAMRRWGGMVVFVFAAIPVLPMDAAGIVAGATRLPLHRYLIAMFSGKMILLTVGFLAARQASGALSFISEWMPMG
jgi:membrane protein YqaA with SNARE-associated domain